MAPNIPISATVSAPSGGLTMDLNNGVSLKVVDWAPPAVTWRRKVVVGRYQSGRKSIGEVIDSATLTGIVRVYGDTWPEARSNAFALIAQLSQHDYTITSIMADRTETYRCEPADVELTTGSFESNKIAGVSGKPRHEYTVTIPCDPIPSEEA